MLTVETIARVRREQARGKSVRAIARDLRLSRDTVTKYLRSGETEAKYERHCQPYPQLGPFLAALEELLERNGRQPARDRLDKRQLFEALRRAGYAGGYDAVRRYVCAGRISGDEDGGQGQRGIHSADLRAGRGCASSTRRRKGSSSTASPSRSESRTPGFATAACPTSGLIRARAKR